MPRRESRVVVWVLRVCIAAVCVHMLFFTWSIIRRYWQVMRLDVTASSTTLIAGSIISFDVVTSGETQNRIRLELVQGTHAEMLLEQRAAVNAVSAYDPRVFEYLRSVTITPQLLSRFAPGAATIRLTGFGGQKLLHVPAPRIREIPVQLAPH
jgi:hypothetical protein